MGANFSVNGSNTTITLTITGPTATIQTVFESVCQYLWNDGMGNHGDPMNPNLYSVLTNLQKLDIFYVYMMKSIKSILAIDARNKSAISDQANIDSFGL